MSKNVISQVNEMTKNKNNKSGPIAGSSSCNIINDVSDSTVSNTGEIIPNKTGKRKPPHPQVNASQVRQSLEDAESVIDNHGSQMKYHQAMSFTNGTLTNVDQSQAQRHLVEILSTKNIQKVGQHVKNSNNHNQNIKQQTIENGLNHASGGESLGNSIYQDKNLSVDGEIKNKKKNKLSSGQRMLQRFAANQVAFTQSTPNSNKQTLDIDPLGGNHQKSIQKMNMGGGPNYDDTVDEFEDYFDISPQNKKQTMKGNSALVSDVLESIPSTSTGGLRGISNTQKNNTYKDLQEQLKQQQQPLLIMKPQQITMAKNQSQPQSDQQQFCNKDKLLITKQPNATSMNMTSTVSFTNAKIFSKSEMQKTRYDMNASHQDQYTKEQKNKVFQTIQEQTTTAASSEKASHNHRQAINISQTGSHSSKNVIPDMINKQQITDQKHGNSGQKSQKPPVGQQTHSSVTNTPQPQEPKKLFNDNDQQTLGKKTTIMNKRVAIPISQVGLQTNSGKPSQGVTNVGNDGQNVKADNQANVQKDSKGPRLSISQMHSAMIKNDGAFQLPEVNNRQQVIIGVSTSNQQMQVNQTPVPRTKKQHLIIPNNQFHFVVGQNNLSHTMTNQSVTISPFKFSASQKFNMTQGSFNQNFTSNKFGIVVAHNEALMQKKRGIIANQNALMQQQQQQQQGSPPLRATANILDDNERDYFYSTIPEEQSPMGYSPPNLKKFTELQIYQSLGNPVQATGYGSPSEMRSVLDPNAGQANNNVFIRSRQIQENQQRDMRMYQYSESPKKEIMMYNSMKSRQKGLECDQKTLNQMLENGQMLYCQDGYMNGVNTISERSEDMQFNKSQKLEVSESRDGISASEGKRFQKEQSRKFIAPIHQQQIFMSDMIQPQALKTQTGFAVRKGQLVKTQTQYGGQFQAVPKPRLSNEGLPAGPIGKIVKIKKEQKDKQKNKNTDKDKNGKDLEGQQQSFQQRVLAQQNKLTSLLNHNEGGEKIEHAFQQIINHKKEKKGQKGKKKHETVNFLNIQRIEAPQAAQNRNVQSRQGTTDQSSRLAKQQSLAKAFKQNIIQEQYLDPETVQKFGLTKRLLFKRRQRMRDKNLLIIYFDGVIGDLPYFTGQCFGFNSFRIRAGAFKDLKELCYQYQVALIFPYVNKRSMVISRYLNKFCNIQIDAAYSVKCKETKPTKKGYLRRWQDYEQIYRDFNLNDHQSIIEQVLIIGCYTAELEAPIETTGDTDISDLVNEKNPELQGLSGIRFRNEAEYYKQVNPIAIMLPHLDLDIGSLCPISTIFQTIECFKNVAWKNRPPPSRQHEYMQQIPFNSLERGPGGPGGVLDYQPLETSQSKSRMNISPEWLPRMNIIETYNQIKQQLSTGGGNTSGFEVGTNRTWKLKCYETSNLQKALLQQEKLPDYLKVKTYQKRNEINNKYLKEDGTYEYPDYLDIHPECTLHQYGTLMNDNAILKQKAIDDYRNNYLGRTDKGIKELIEKQEFPTFDPNEDPCKGIYISDVKLDLMMDEFTMHRMVFLVPSLPVVQRVQQFGYYFQAFEYIDIVKELADNVPFELSNLIQANQQSFEIQDWICRRMFTRPQNNGFIGPSGLAKRKGVQYIDADFHPTAPSTGPANNVISNSMGT